MEGRGCTALSISLLLFAGFVALLIAGLLWAVQKPRDERKLEADPLALEEIGQRHISYLPQIRQALAEEDYQYLSEKASSLLQKRVRRERRNVVRSYLEALREDFQGILRMANTMAALSPEVVAIQEFERLRLTISFSWRYQMIRWRLWAGGVPAAQLDGLSNLVSGLSVRMEAALKEIGERAALAAELASSVDRRGLGAG
jgi:hypothetical protein